MTHITLRYCLMGFVALLLGGPAFWISSRPSRQTSRLGMRGKKRQQGLLRNPTWATIEPFVRWMGVRVNGVLPLSNWSALDELITHAGDYLGMTADEAFGAMVASGVAGGGLIILATSIFVSPQWAAMVAPVAILIAGSLPWLVIDGAKTARFRTIHRSLPYAIDLLALGMSAGLDFPGALAQIVERSKLPEALRDELEYMLQQLKLGHTRANMLRVFAGRAPIEPVIQFAQSVIQAEARGNPMVGTLEIQAQTARIRRSAAAENAARDMKSKMVLPVMLLVGVGLAFISIPSMMMLERFSDGLGGG